MKGLSLGILKLFLLTLLVLRQKQKKKTKSLGYYFQESDNAFDLI